MHLHALLKKLPMGVFQVAPHISVPYVKVEITESLNRWDLSSQRVSLTLASFHKVAIKAFIHVNLRVLLDSS